MVNNEEIKQMKDAIGQIASTMVDVQKKLNTHRYIIRQEAIEEAVNWLFDHEWIKRNRFHLSVEQVANKIMATTKSNRKTSQWNRIKF